MATDLSRKYDEYYRSARPEMRRYVPATARRILEVGCGEGLFGAHLKERQSAEVWGVEFEPDRAAAAARRLDRVLQGDIAALMDELPDGYFDAIVCNDVLEHLLDPYTVLARLRGKLAAEGQVVSSIPNVRYFRNFLDLVFLKNWDYTSEGVMDFTHYRFFTSRSIRKMFEGAGYEVLRHEGVNPTTALKVWPVVLLSLGYFNDIRYLQYATVATPRASS